MIKMRFGIWKTKGDTEGYLFFCLNLQIKFLSMNLSKVIFWDTNYDTINWGNKARYVIEKVVMYGTVEDWNAIKAFYGMNRIKTETLQSRDLDAKTLSFLSCIFKIPKEQFRCYTERQSQPQHWIY